MYCTNCGAKVRDDASFCPNCGWSVPRKSERPGNAARNSSNSLASSDKPAIETMSAKQERLKHRATRVKVSVACILLVSIAVTGALLYMHSTAGFDGNRDISEGEDSTTLTPQPVSIVINAPGYSSSATRIPLHIMGTDLAGAEIDTTEYVGVDDTSLQLSPGTYQVKVLASPILENGSVYQVPDDPIELSVPDSSDNENSANASGDTSAVSSDSNAASFSITLEPAANPLMVTEEQIETSKEAAASDPKDNGKGAELAKVASDALETAKERSQLAVDYIQATQTVQEPLPENDMDITTADEATWKTSVLSYLEPGTSVYDAYNKFGMMAATIIRDPQVTSIDGDTYTVSYQEAGTQNPTPGWSRKFSTTTTRITFNSNNKIIRDELTD